MATKSRTINAAVVIREALRVQLSVRELESDSERENGNKRTVQSRHAAQNDRHCIAADAQCQQYCRSPYLPKRHCCGSEPTTHPLLQSVSSRAFMPTPISLVLFICGLEAVRRMSRAFSRDVLCQYLWAGFMTSSSRPTVDWASCLEK
eukprot:853188-Rhodomonas_salina.3